LGPGIPKIPGELKIVFSFNGPQRGHGRNPVDLSRLPVGAPAVVEAVEEGSPVSVRLLDLGFVPGTAVRALRRAPLGDPTLYEVRGTQLCLRRSEALRVKVRLLPVAAGGRP
jgi:ferrous iron transport protein A